MTHDVDAIKKLWLLDLNNCHLYCSIHLKAFLREIF